MSARRTAIVPVISKAAVGIGRAMISVANAITLLQRAERELTGQPILNDLRIASGPLVAFEGRLRQELVIEAQK